jgi:hypothetical protein
MSRIIKLFSSSHWSHVAMYVGDALAADGFPDCEIYRKRYGRDAAHMLVEAFSGKGVIASPVKTYEHFNIRLCRPYGIVEADLKKVVEHVIHRLGRHYDDQNILDIALMALRSFFGLKSKHTLRACLGNCNDFQVICSGMIAQAFQSVGYPIVPALVPAKPGGAFTENNPYGGGLIMRHYTQISPRDFDLSPNFEIIKFNIIGTETFDYRSLWASAGMSGNR